MDSLRLDTEIERPVYDLLTLPLSPSLDAFVDLVCEGTEEVRFDLAPTAHFRPVPRGLVPGLNFFGADDSRLFEIYRHNSAPMRCVDLYAVTDAVVSPYTFTAFSAAGGFYGPLIDDWNPDVIAHLRDADPVYAFTEGPAFRVRPDRALMPCYERPAMMLGGRGVTNYGHFLFDGLPLIFLLRQAYPWFDLALAGPRLQPFQREILSLLDLEGAVVELSEPTVFRRMLLNSHSTLHVAHPTRYVRPLFDFLRFRCGVGIASRERRIFVSRGAGFPERRVMTNRPAVEEMVRAHGFEVIYPEQMSVREQIVLYASSRMVIGETGAASANLGFCDPGTVYLEIQPENFLDSFGRGVASMFGINWFLLGGRTVAASEGQCAYEVDLDLLARAIAAAEPEMC